MFMIELLEVALNIVTFSHEVALGFDDADSEHTDDETSDEEEEEGYKIEAAAVAVVVVAAEV